MSALITLADSADRDVWLEARRQLLTASDVASVLGFGHQSRKAVVREKVLGEVNAYVGRMAQVDAGRFFEEAIAQWFASDHGVRVDPYRLLVAREDTPWLGATPDFVIDWRTPLECKNCGFETRANWHVESQATKGWPRHVPLPVPVEIRTRYPTMNLKVAAEDVGTVRGAFRDAVQVLMRDHVPALGAPVAPIKYFCQLAVQMFVLDVGSGWVSAGVGGTARIDLKYERSAQFEEYWLGECKQFWDEVCSTRAGMEGL